MPDLTMDDSVRAVLDKFSWDAHPSKHLKHFEIGAFDLETSLATDEVMHITEQNVSDADVVALSKALKLMVPTNMKNVYLSSNRIGDEGCRHIAEAAACLPNFELLFLARNQIGDAGVAGIAQQLAAAPKLWQLVLTENQFGDEGVKALADAAISDAGAFGALKWLFLDGNNITDKGVQALATAMTTGFQGLTRLALQNTKLTNKGLKALVRTAARMATRTPPPHAARATTASRTRCQPRRFMRRTALHWMC